MGYSVYYRGEITVTPPLTEQHAAALKAFSRLEPTADTNPIFAAITSSPEPDLPGYGGLIDVSEDGSLIVPEEDESRHGVRLWLRLMIELSSARLATSSKVRSSGLRTNWMIVAASSSGEIWSRPLTISSSMPDRVGALTTTPTRS